MKKFLINLFLPSKYKDIFKKSQDMLKGKKSYIAGLILVLQGLFKVIGTYTGFENAGQLVDWLGSAINSEGAILIMNGLAVFGIRAGIKKTEK
jgi:hypothetical protein